MTDINKGDFTHTMYDDATDTLFMYIENATIQNLTEGIEGSIEEVCIWLNPKKIPSMIEHLQKALREYVEYGP